MWPFARKKNTTPVPAVRCQGIDIAWNPRFHWWEFSVGAIDYSLSDNPIFDTSLLSDLPVVTEWLTQLDAQIDAELSKNLDGWCEWTGKKELVGIDVSRLVDTREIDVAYANDDWGDLGVNIVIREGRITGSYAGD